MKLKKTWILIDKLIRPFGYRVVCTLDKYYVVEKYKIERIKDFNKTT